MSFSVPAHDFAPAADEPLSLDRANWAAWAGPGISLVVLGAVCYQLRTLDARSLLALVPRSPGFWAVFALYYLAGPISEWVIFRRLWRLPPAGFAALLRKLVSNELLLGYLGEVYFYAWARRHGRITSAPFAAIKDVAILSAIVGNVATLVMVVAAAPLLGSLDLGRHALAFETSAAVVLMSSLGVMLLRRRLFSLPRRILWMVSGVHALRVAATILLGALLWHLLLPAVALGWWLLLGAVRQVLSRLPLLPNKDLVFAGVAAILVGRQGGIVAAMALMASLILATHIVVGTVFGAAELAAGRRA